MRLKVGSLVQVIEPGTRHPGRRGRLLQDDHSALPYQVGLTDSEIEWFYEHELEAVPEAASRASAFETAVDQAFADAKALLLERHAKYGPTNISQTPYGWKVGLITRISDKLARLRHMEGDATDEPRTDAWLDAANYGIIGLLNERGEWPND